MSIKHRFFALVFVFAALALSIATLAMRTMGEYDAIMGEYRNAYENALRGERLNRLVSTAVMESRGIYLSKTADESRQFSDSLNSNLGQIEALMRNWRTDAVSRQRGLTPQLTEDVKAFIVLRRELARYGRDNNIAAAMGLGVPSRSNRKALQDRVDNLTANMKAHLILTETHLESYKADRKRDFIVVVSFGILLMILTCLIMIRRYIQEPLQSVTQSIIRISEGDYAAPIPDTKPNSDLNAVWYAVNVLKERSKEHERLRREEHEAETKMRELMLD